MYNTNDLSFDAVSTNVCQNCGKVALTYDETAAASKKVGIGYAIIGWLFSVVSLLFVPILFGPIAFALGLITFYSRSKAHGASLMVFAAITFILGSLLSLFVSGTLFI
jgi:hypothetical protein